MMAQEDSERGFSTTEKKTGLSFRSTAAASASGDAVVAVTTAVDSWKENPQSISKGDIEDDTKEEEFDTITLPESTHTLLFTESITSTPFIIGIFIAGLSVLCLILALLNNGAVRGVNSDIKEVIPANVPQAVKISQYASIIIALLMEEEIPTALYLLRRIPKQYFISKFPELQYSKFVCSCVLRIFMGYMFLGNVLLLLIQANNVLEIFFDFIALQFLQQLDDIAFKLARIGVFSKSFRVATTNKYFCTKFKRPNSEKNRRVGIFLKAVYFFNFCGLLSAMIYVSTKQSKGDFQCKEITVRMSDDIWDESVVKWPGGGYEEMVLVYSYFNGVYAQDGTIHDERPVYVEMNKYDNAPFNSSGIEIPEYDWIWEAKVPAKLQYCNNIRAWAFTHEYIRKSRRDDSDCPWLLRSEETDVYDIEEVQGPWQVWEGVIGTTDMHISCNECSDNSDCNLNGECKDGSCECYDDVDGVTFLGPHCEVRVKDECRTIAGEQFNETWSIVNFDWTSEMETGFLQVYNRPVYQLVQGPSWLNETAVVYLIYSGNRWFGTYFEYEKDVLESKEFRAANEWGFRNYHAFWNRVYRFGTVITSDVTTEPTPVGVDFYMIGKRDDHYGPFGLLHPMTNVTGSGHFRCVHPIKANEEVGLGRNMRSIGSRGIVTFP